MLFIRLLQLPCCHSYAGAVCIISDPSDHLNIPKARTVMAPILQSFPARLAVAGGPGSLGQEACLPQGAMSES